MKELLNSNKSIDAYLGHLEDLSSKIASNISLGLFSDINKMDLERRNIINKISNDASNLNETRKNRLKLVWVNNNQMVKDLEEAHSKKKKELNLVKKTYKAYTLNSQ